MQFIFYFLFSSHAQANDAKQTFKFCFNPRQLDRTILIEIEIASIISRHIEEFLKETNEPKQTKLNLYVMYNDLEQLFTYYKTLLLDINEKLEQTEHENKFAQTILSFTKIIRLLDSLLDALQHHRNNSNISQINDFMSDFKYAEIETEDIVILQDFTICLLALCLKSEQFGDFIRENHRNFFWTEREPMVYVYNLGDVKNIFDEHYKRCKHFTVKLNEAILLNIVAEFDILLYKMKPKIEIASNNRVLRFMQFLNEMYSGLSTGKRCTDIEFGNCAIVQQKIDLMIRHLGIYSIDESEMLRKRFLYNLEIVKGHFRTIFVGEENLIIDENQEQMNLIIIYKRTSIF